MSQAAEIIELSNRRSILKEDVNEDVFCLKVLAIREAVS
jgi:hypothetical protein